MLKQSTIASLQDLIFTANDSKAVVRYLVERIEAIVFDSLLCLDFFSLGDLLKGSILLNAIRTAFPNLEISIRLSEEYYDEKHILNAFARQYGTTIARERNPRNRPIAVFDTQISAYRFRAKEYLAVIPAQHLTLLQDRGGNSANSRAREILGIEPNARVLTIGNYTTTDIGSNDLEHITDPKIRGDFIKTHYARHISKGTLERLIKTAIAEDLFDHIILVPRNIREDFYDISALSSLPFLDVINYKSRRSLPARVHLLAAKGVLRGAYAAANVAVVMGHHNVLEPFLSDPTTRTYCFEPPLAAPNRFLFECGSRYGLLRSVERFPTGESNRRDFLKNLATCSFNPDPKGFEKDQILTDSIEETASYLANALTIHSAS